MGTATLDEQEVFDRPVGGDGNPSGPQRRLTFVGDAGDTGPEARNPDVAFNSRAGEFLVVWSGTPTAPNDEDIFAQRVSPSGQRLGDPVQVSQAGGVGPGSDGDNQLPRVAYNPQSDEYLVAWRDSADVNPGEIRAQRLVGASAAEVGDDDFLITDEGGEFDAQRVDVDYGSAANEFLVVWSDDISGAGEDEILARRVTAAGGLPAGAVRVSQQGTDGDTASTPTVPPSPTTRPPMSSSWPGPVTARTTSRAATTRLRSASSG